ncbi:MAG: hypothetical protein QG579_393 [Patescibacteria group bacterium]|jgi:hypothetical protein|nr:hypothetical protein [Patescibacteria group bacterium]
MSFEQFPTEPSQEQLVQDYLSAYEEYKTITDKRSSDLKVLDGLRDDSQSQEAVTKQQELYDSTRGEQERALEKYKAIGEKLTPETKDKYLKETV